VFEIFGPRSSFDARERSVGNQLKTLRKWLGSHTFAPIDNAGHLPQVEKPEEFAAVIRRVE